MKDNILMIYRHASSLIVAGLVFFLVACDDTASAKNTATPVSATKSRPGTTENTDRTLVLEGRLSVLLPDGYQKMNTEMMADAFGHVPVRPSEVWYRESEEGRVMLGFTKTSEKFMNSQRAPLLKMMEKQMASASPRITQATVNGEEIYRIETTSTTVIAGKGPTGVTTILQPSVLDGRLMFTTFTFPASLKEKYIKDAEEILSSVK
jgi:hypothetical protein